MIRRLLAGSLRRRFQPLAVIALAATVAAATVAAAAGLGERLAARAAESLHAAGPNLLVRPQVGGPERLPVGEMERVLATPGVLAAAGMAEEEKGADLELGPEGDLRVLLTGPEEGRLPVLAVTGGLFDVRPGWEVDGERPAAGEALVGAAVPRPGEATGSPPAEGPSVAGGEGGGSGLRVAGVLTTGEGPDRGVLVPLEALGGARGGAPALVDRIEVRAAADRLEETAAAIEARVAGAEARPLVRVTATEASLVRKLQLLVAGVGAVCLLLALATVGSATLALLEDRRREMALFLALGYTGRWVQGLLTAELALVGLTSVAAGGLLGEAGAAALAGALLGEVGGYRPGIAGLAAGLVAVALVMGMAAALVRRRVERLEPAPVLQGR